MTGPQAQAAPRIDEMGPIDYVVVEWTQPGPRGELAPLLLDLVDRGLINVLDVAVLAKDRDGTVGARDFGDLGSGLGEFAGAATGLLGQDDLEEAANALEPNTVAAVLVWENRWAAPFASGVRQTGGQLVASGRIPVQAILASLDALDNRTT